jgi:pimeloyl-ACP methyl ester carboxylesterase
MTVSPGKVDDRRMTTTSSTEERPTMSPTNGSTTTDEIREFVVHLPDGRVLAVADRGPIDGQPVVFLHSAPGSRVFDPDPEATRAAGVRLITIDRAGYGGSSPLATGSIPSVAGQADDTAAVLEHLGVRDAAIDGWSAGGRVAIATAARHPELARHVVLVATPAPDDQVPWVGPEHRAMAEAMREDPASAVATITAVFAGTDDPTASADDGPAPDAESGAEPGAGAGADDLVAMVTAGGEADAALLDDPEVRVRVEAMLGVGFQGGPAGVATDIVADQVVPWGFDVAAVGVPVTLVYGDADAVLTPDHGRWYADQLVDAEVRVVPGGHLVVVTEWSAILDAVLTG